MTAGSGIVHAEMFPLLEQEEPNPTELFQIWINLPSQSKFVDPHFSMFWSETIPERTTGDPAGRKTKLRVIAGALGDDRAPAPPPDSWASNTQADVAIWSLRLEPKATFSLPAAKAGVHRTLYFFRGSTLLVGTRELRAPLGARIAPGEVTTLLNGEREAHVLVLQGRPIAEPVARRGPFVMNDQQQIRQAFEDYQRTQFGGWPWPRQDPVHAATDGRFAIHADGRRDKPS
jgi:redox-sensitive bicupin YhaK (pirin superfamily)